MPDPPLVDLSRYHDLTRRLAVFATDGGAFLRGDADGLEIRDAEPALEPDEREVARIAGVVELLGARSTPGRDETSSVGLVLHGRRAVVVVTTERLIVMAQTGLSQLGTIAPGEVHTFVLPWDLVGSVSMPQRRDLADRVAGARRIDLLGSVVLVDLAVTPAGVERAGAVVKMRDEDVFRVLVDTGAEHRKRVSPAGARPRLEAVQRGAVAREDGELVAWLTDAEASGVPDHLVGRLRASAELRRRRRRAAAVLLTT